MKKHLLVVDDDPVVLESLRRLLEKADYRVHTATDAETALAQFSEFPVDLVILDLNLPLRAGWDAFEELTRNNPFLPTIIVTGMPNQYKVALAAGAGALFEKPVDPLQLLATVHRLISEPKSVRLERLCGYGPEPDFVPQIRANMAQKSDSNDPRLAGPR